MLTFHHVVVGHLLTVETLGGVHLAAPTPSRLPQQRHDQFSLILLLAGDGQQVEHVLRRPQRLLDKCSTPQVKFLCYNIKPLQTSITVDDFQNLPQVFAGDDVVLNCSPGENDEICQVIFVANLESLETVRNVSMKQQSVILYRNISQIFLLKK